MTAADETTLEADGLRVVFFRQVDRYAHRIECFDAARSEWIADGESLEGSPDDDWPPSPPFQQLHVEERPTGRVVLLIGMAGRTHWSAAVEAAADKKSITFDVAARVQTMPTRLGSAYQNLREGAALAQPCRFSGVQSPQLPTDAPATIAWQYSLFSRS